MLAGSVSRRPTATPTVYFAGCCLSLECLRSSALCEVACCVMSHIRQMAGPVKLRDSTRRCSRAIARTRSRLKRCPRFATFQRLLPAYSRRLQLRRSSSTTEGTDANFCRNGSLRAVSSFSLSYYNTVSLDLTIRVKFVVKLLQQ